MDTTLTEREAPREGTSLRTWSWIGVGAGATLLAIGGGAYALRERDLDYLKRSCVETGSRQYDCSDADPQKYGELKRTNNRADTLDTVVVTAGGLGAAALLLGGVGLWHTAGVEDNDEPHAQLGLWVAGTQAGLSGSF